MYESTVFEDTNLGVISIEGMDNAGTLLFEQTFLLQQTYDLLLV